MGVSGGWEGGSQECSTSGFLEEIKIEEGSKYIKYEYWKLQLFLKLILTK
jgi:hypothetical protein